MQTGTFFSFFITASLICGGIGSRSVYADEPILKMQGLVAEQNISFELNLRSIDKMPQTSISTTTPWHRGVTTFSGVLLKDLLTAVNLTGARLRIIALNDYEVEASIPDLVEADELLATRQNGELMAISDKGPLFMIFPFDSRSELQHQRYYSRAVWQIAEIDVR
ncbi:hypothetical protein QE372_005195 [Agrobacterium pusense]|uniref:oxidoreductase n=1 Tax=Agrobacterium pusense TaxID=648995 RepID=UPI00285496D1|nr:oxidoreductase [Agrobacterium pusense]MDR6192861.1 hypothetical protein [Agrobacterium pusense]